MALEHIPATPLVDNQPRANLMPEVAAPYSRVRGSNRYDQVAEGRRRRRTVLTAVLCALVAAVVVGAGAAVASIAGFYSSVSSRLNDNVTAETKAVLAEQQANALLSVDAWDDTTPFYMLILGVDSDEEREETTGPDDGLYRTDTIILARVDPGNKKVALVSIHRDTWYAINGVEQKINNAYSLGGVAKTIEVISEYAGVPITHYAQVNMDAFNAITDALGGVWVDVPFEINDTVLPGHLDAGYQCLSGEQAQIFVRSRHAYDDLGDGDRYRAAHQRLFLSAMLGQLMSASVSTMVDVIDQVADYVETDLTVEQIVSLAMAMRGIDTEEDVYSTMNPTTATYTNGVWYEISNDAYWKEIMAQVDSGQKPDVDYNYLSVTDDINNPDHTSSGTDGDAAAEAADAVVETEPTYVSDAVVAVKNASGDAEKAAAVLAELQGGGWNAQDGGTANSQVNTTAVVYENAAFAADAQAVADAVGGYAVEAGDTWLISSGDIMVVVGAN